MFLSQLIDDLMAIYNDSGDMEVFWKNGKDGELYDIDVVTERDEHVEMY